MLSKIELCYVTLVKQYRLCHVAYARLVRRQIFISAPKMAWALSAYASFSSMGTLGGRGKHLYCSLMWGKKTLRSRAPVGDSPDNSFEETFMWPYVIGQGRLYSMSVLLCCPTEKATRDHGNISYCCFLTNRPLFFTLQPKCRPETSKLAFRNSLLKRNPPQMIWNYLELPCVL